MGFIFTLIFLCLLITGLVYALTDNKNKRMDEATCAATATGILSIVLILIVWFFSYATYLNMNKDLAVIEQYKESIELYASKGVAEFKPGTYVSRELTDLKYNNYQVQIGQMIVDLRDKIVEYNRTFAGKSIMKNSWYWGWCIILSDDMAPVKMEDYIK